MATTTPPPPLLSTNDKSQTPATPSKKDLRPPPTQELPNAVPQSPPSHSPERTNDNENNNEKPSNDSNTLPPKVQQNLRKLRFHNYTPRTDALKTYSDQIEETPEDSHSLQQTIDKYEHLLRTTNSKFMDPALDLDNLLPKTRNSDMNAALTAKLSRLQKRTRRAVVDIARRRQLADGDLTGVPPPATEAPSSDDD